MDAQVSYMTRVVKAHDRELYAARDYRNNVTIFRNDWVLNHCYPSENCSLSYLVHQPQVLFSLTDNWRQSGQPREWGGEVVLNRLKAMDLALRPDFFAEFEKEDEKKTESKKRDFRNTVESFMLDYRKDFARQFNDVNTSTLAKIDPRAKRDRRIKNGY